jgi:hypothetical protein
MAKIRHISVFITLSFILSACITGNNNTAGVKLFNENNLNNWTQVGAAIWKVSERQISVADPKADGFLVTKEKYSNFKLSLEFWVDEKVNSGVFIRCSDADKITPFNCYEMNIWDKHPKQEYRTGSIVTFVSPPLAQVKTVNKWNKYEIIADQNNILVTVNGIVTARLEDTKHSSGYIALQSANNGSVRFRNIILEEL